VVSVYLRSTARGTELILHVQPGAAQAQIVGLHGDALKVRIPARAVEGAANDALQDFIAYSLGLSRREVRILRGEKSRRKVLQLQLPADVVAERLARQMKTDMVGERS
jgi:uncharacterized protein (TIGR00251 family)